MLCKRGNALCYSVNMASRSVTLKSWQHVLLLCYHRNAFCYSVTRQRVLLFYNNDNSLSFSVTVATRFVNCKHINAFGHSVTMTRALLFYNHSITFCYSVTMAKRSVIL
jgi:hypothetical protein